MVRYLPGSIPGPFTGREIRDRLGPNMVEIVSTVSGITMHKVRLAGPIDDLVKSTFDDVVSECRADYRGACVMLIDESGAIVRSVYVR